MGQDKDKDDRKDGDKDNKDRKDEMDEDTRSADRRRREEDVSLGSKKLHICAYWPVYDDLLYLCTT